MCAYYGCPHGISIDIVEDCATKEHASLFEKFYLESFVDTAPYLSFCKAPDCDYCILVDEKYLSDKNNLAQQNASCHCGTPVCLRCKGESHEPLNCKMYKSWDDQITKIYDKLNYLWKLDNTKKCPGCKANIQKNEGCNYMQCAKCKFKFCWFCLQDWKLHDQKHVWKASCNVFKAKKTVDEMNEEEKLKRMEFYMDRYRGHKRSYELNDDRIKKHLKKIEDTDNLLHKLNNEVSFFFKTTGV
jgi:hypothetical protein